ncbi:hypothetical protein S83_017412 [Arachis hypogaea]
MVPPSCGRPPSSPLLYSPTPLFIRQLLRVASLAPVRQFVAHRPWLSAGVLAQSRSYSTHFSDRRLQIQRGSSSLLAWISMV